MNPEDKRAYGPEFGTEVNMELKQVVKKAREVLQELVNLEVSSVTEVSKDGDVWRVSIEMVERKAVPDTQDILGTYAVVLDEEGKLASFERMKVRRRMDLEEVVE